MATIRSLRFAHLQFSLFLPGKKSATKLFFFHRSKVFCKIFFSTLYIHPISDLAKFFFLFKLQSNGTTRAFSKAKLMHRYVLMMMMLGFGGREFCAHANSYGGRNSRGRESRYDDICESPPVESGGWVNRASFATIVGGWVFAIWKFWVLAWNWKNDEIGSLEFEGDTFYGKFATVSFGVEWNFQRGGFLRQRVAEIATAMKTSSFSLRVMRRVCIRR